MGTQQPVEEAQTNARLNNITNCKYFVGSSEEVIHEVAENIKYDKACAVVICSENHVSVCECLLFLDMKEVLSSLSGLLFCILKSFPDYFHPSFSVVYPRCRIDCCFYGNSITVYSVIT